MDSDRLKAAVGHKFALKQHIQSVNDMIAFAKVAIRDAPVKGEVSNSEYNLAAPAIEFAVVNLVNLRAQLASYHKQLKDTNRALDKMESLWKSPTPLETDVEHFKGMYKATWNVFHTKHKIATSSTTGVHDVSPPQFDRNGIEYEHFGFALRDFNGSLDDYSKWEQTEYKPHGGFEKHMKLSKKQADEVFARNSIIRIGIDSEGYKLNADELELFQTNEYDKDSNLYLTIANPRGIQYKSIQEVAEALESALIEKFPHGVYNISAMEIANLVVGTNSEKARLTPTKTMINVVCRLTDRLRSLGGTRGYWYTPYKSRKTKHYAIADDDGVFGKKSKLGNKK